MTVSLKDLVIIITTFLIVFSIFVTLINFVVNFDTGDIISGILLSALIGVTFLKIILPIKIILWTAFLVIFPSYNFLEVFLLLIME